MKLYNMDPLSLVGCQAIPRPRINLIADSNRPYRVSTQFLSNAK